LNVNHPQYEQHEKQDVGEILSYLNYQIKLWYKSFHGILVKSRKICVCFEFSFEIKFVAAIEFKLRDRQEAEFHSMLHNKETIEHLAYNDEEHREQRHDDSGHESE